MKKFRALGIEYDTDGMEVELPAVLEVECDDESMVADAISDKTGFLVSSIGGIQEI